MNMGTRTLHGACWTWWSWEFSCSLCHVVGQIRKVKKDPLPEEAIAVLLICVNIVLPVGIIAYEARRAHHLRQEHEEHLAQYDKEKHVAAHNIHSPTKHENPMISELNNEDEQETTQAREATFHNPIMSEDD